jgi:hypothetical protein
MGWLRQQPKENAMCPSSLNLSYGSVSFAAEGDENWLSTQLDKVLGAADALGRAAPSPLAVKSAGASADNSNGSQAITATLASHLKAKGGEVSQVMRFLATADWLRLRSSAKLNTSAVAKALSENRQKRLGNPADCLNKNVAKGFCEKSGDDFFITPDGLKALGYS